MVDDKKRCVIIAASPDLDGKFLCDNISENDFIICAGYKQKVIKEYW